MKAPPMSMDRRTDDEEAHDMTWLLFIGDMLVMLFMCVLVVWVYLKSTSEAADEAARIPLQDEHADD
jgi:cbb3-type cytochrome oxidase subunit 3